jgi:hypothetical protein
MVQAGGSTHHTLGAGGRWGVGQGAAGVLAEAMVVGGSNSSVHATLLVQMGGVVSPRAARTEGNSNGSCYDQQARFEGWAMRSRTAA